MKKTFALIPAVLLTLFSSCVPPLEPSLPQDLVIGIGRFGSASGNISIKGVAGGKIVVPIQIADQSGNAVSGTYTVAFSLSPDADLSTAADDTALGERSVPAGAETLVELNNTAAAGSYYLIASLVGVTDAAANNNAAIVQAVLGAPGPDLTISVAAQAKPWTAAPGTKGKVFYTITNLGTAAVASGTAVSLSFYAASTNPTTVTTPATGSATVTLSSALNPYDSVTGEAAITMPSAADLAADRGQTEANFTVWIGGIVAVVDSTDTIAETNEGNNSGNTGASSVLSYVSGKPDLTLLLDYPSDKLAVKGSHVDLSVRVWNRGFAPASGYTVTLFVDLNTNTMLDAGDVTLRTWTGTDGPTVPFDSLNPLSPAYTRSSVVLSVPEGIVWPDNPSLTYDGTRSYRIAAVVSGLADEWAGWGNFSSVENIKLLPSSVDLSMDYMSTSLSAPLDRSAGGSVPVTFKVRNGGDDTMETDFTVHFYSTNDNTLDTSTDADLGSVTVTDPIAPKTSLVRTVNLNFPAAAGPCFYTVYWVIDPAGAVRETNETNNKPGSVDDCFVFVPMLDDAVGVNARLLVYKPLGAPQKDGYIYAVFNDGDYLGSGWAYVPGTIFFATYYPFSFTGSSTLEFRFNGHYYSDYKTPYAFRVVPSYVGSVPTVLIPRALSGEDGFEPNDSNETAYRLSGSNNPLLHFVSAYMYATDGYTEYDYYSVGIP